MPIKNVPIVARFSSNKKKVRYNRAKNSSGGAKSFAKRVKAVVLRVAETKTTGFDPVAYTFGGAGANNALMGASVDLSDAFEITQGTGQADRIGNKINITKAMLNLNIYVRAGDPPAVVSVYIGYLKGNRFGIPSATDFTRLLQDGNTGAEHTNTTLSMLRPINKDLFVARKYTFKVGPATLALSSFANNDYKLFVNRKINLKQLLGNFQFTVDNNAGSHNKSLFMWCQWNAADSSVQAIGASPVLNWFVETGFKDM